MALVFEVSSSSSSQASSATTTVLFSNGAYAIFVEWQNEGFFFLWCIVMHTQPRAKWLRLGRANKCNAFLLLLHYVRRWLWQWPIEMPSSGMPALVVQLIDIVIAACMSHVHSPVGRASQPPHTRTTHTHISLDHKLRTNKLERQTIGMGSHYRLLN